MKKLLPAFAVGAFVLLVVAAPIAFTQFSKQSVPPAPEPTVQNVLRVTQVIELAGTAATTEQIETTQGKTALDILDQTHEIETKEYSFGKLVESVDNVRNGTDNKYWTYFVNDQEASVGAAEYQVKNKDQIKWKFSEYDEE
jgi:hypothetical protein